MGGASDSEEEVEEVKEETLEDKERRLLERFKNDDAPTTTPSQDQILPEIELNPLGLLYYETPLTHCIDHSERLFQALLSEKIERFDVLFQLFKLRADTFCEWGVESECVRYTPQTASRLMKRWRSVIRQARFAILSSESPLVMYRSLKHKFQNLNNPMKNRGI